MKTYVMEVDGRPTVAFRAENESSAAKRVDAIAGWLRGHTKPTHGVATFRLATVPEQEKWRRQSVALLLDEEGDEHADVNIDGLVARLDDEEE